MTLLKELKILDFSSMLPGPFATLMLSDLGADVLRVEKPSNTDSWVVDQYLHRGKKRMALDLKLAESIQQIKELLPEYDIVLEQFRPGVMERLGLGYEELKKWNSKLIYCSLTGYGQTGPYQDKAGHDINYLSISGLAGYSGTKEGGPAVNSTQIADLAGGSLHTAVGILSAVIYRHQTGEGQHLDISMTDAAFTLNALSAPLHLVNGEQLEPEELILNGGTFYGYYRTKDDRFFSVGSLEPSFRKNLCDALGRPDLLELSFKTDKESVKEFQAMLEEIFKQKTFLEWEKIFADTDACVEPVLTFEEACNHPQIQERGLITEVEMDDGSIQKQIASPIQSSVMLEKAQTSRFN